MKADVDKVVKRLRLTESEAVVKDMLARIQAFAELANNVAGGKPLSESEIERTLKSLISATPGFGWPPPRVSEARLVFHTYWHVKPLLKALQASGYPFDWNSVLTALRRIRKGATVRKSVEDYVSNARAANADVVALIQKLANKLAMSANLSLERVESRKNRVVVTFALASPVDDKRSSRRSAKGKRPKQANRTVPRESAIVTPKSARTRVGVKDQRESMRAKIASFEKAARVNSKSSSVRYPRRGNLLGF